MHAARCELAAASPPFDCIHHNICRSLFFHRVLAVTKMKSNVLLSVLLHPRAEAAFRHRLFHFSFFFFFFFYSSISSKPKALPHAVLEILRWVPERESASALDSSRL